MSVLKEIRLATGMSQREFSSLLGIERSHYSLAEIGLRSLCTNGEVKLMHFQMSLQQNKGVFKLPYLEEEIVQEKQELQALQRKINRKQFHLELKLSKMETQLVNAQTAYQLCIYLTQNKLLEDTVAERVIVNARSKIFANGKLYQEKVKSRLLLLREQASSISQQLEQLNQNPGL